MFATRVTQLKIHYFSGGVLENKISKRCMESYQFPSTYSVISRLLCVVYNSKGQIFELCHCSSEIYPINMSTLPKILFLQPMCSPNLRRLDSATLDGNWVLATCTPSASRTNTSSFPSSQWLSMWLPWLPTPWGTNL